MKSILYFCFEKCLIALTHLHIVPVLQLPLLKTKVSLHTKKSSEIALCAKLLPPDFCYHDVA